MTRPWKASERAELRQLYPDPRVPIAELALRFGRSMAAIVGQAHRNGLQRPARRCPHCGQPRPPARPLNTGVPAVRSPELAP